MGRTEIGPANVLGIVKGEGRLETKCVRALKWGGMRRKKATNLRIGDMSRMLHRIKYLPSSKDWTGSGDKRGQFATRELLAVPDQLDHGFRSNLVTRLPLSDTKAAANG